MTSRSFKQDLTGRPLRYRTPSPPRDAVEFISPVDDNALEPTFERNGIQWSSNNLQTGARRKSDVPISADKTDYHHRSYSHGTMDAFASIALATGSTVPPHRTNHSEQMGHRDGSAFVISDCDLGRPAKRARSEKLPSPEVRRSNAGRGARPATSYEQLADNRVFEAELLLNFAQEARFAVPHEPSYQNHQRTDSSELAVPVNAPARLHYQQGSGTDQHGVPSTQSDSNTHNNNYGSWTVQERDLGPVFPSNTVESDEPSTPFEFILQQSPSRATRSNIVENVGALTPTMHSPQASESARVTNSQHQEARSQITDSCSSDLITVKSPPSSTYIANKEPQSPGRPVADTPAGGEVASGVQKRSAEEYNHSRDGAGISEHLDSFKNSESWGKERAEIVSLQQPTETVTAPISLDFDDNVNRLKAKYNAEAGSPDTTLETDHSKNIGAAVCTACNFSRSNIDGEMDSNSTSWISCDACKAWFHFACAGFKNEREVRGVDKYRCRKCRPSHGPTTFVRKSARAHSAIDYAGLHQGVLKTSDETPEHHYIKPIKEGTITFLPETFARIRPELVTAEYFEKGQGWKEPIVVPAAWNPCPQAGAKISTPQALDALKSSLDVSSGGLVPREQAFADTEPEFMPDHGQDALDMVMPHGLTVRAVAELYGPEEKVEVIDVKSQNGEGKKWNMRRWADYYESKGNKIVRNVISLEVSQSKLGRLIRRPQIVRDLDLQDCVWPAELQAKGEIPRVQFYCLMSVADCFTDFHIDFGGSSVFYHILKGKKTFFFIPPKEKHLKRYEEWCLSPAQNWTFLGDQTKECYRVDLSEGDTMFIPAGWIHAVWTPEDSLVIGGNFLTRLNYGMQLRISQIEKATGVARKFRYPHFQKIHWYTAFRYLEEDPLPDLVQKLLQEGEIFYREKPAHHEFDDWGENSRSGLGNYHARYYSQAELEGLPDLTRYLLRTALIDLGSITDGITQETRNAVKRSIPRGHGEPLEVVKKFAAWCAWKRGNETIPSWAYPDAVPEPECAAKVSAAAQKKLDREAALQAPRRQSARMQSQQTAPSTEVNNIEPHAPGLITAVPTAAGTYTPTDTGSSSEALLKRKLSNSGTAGQIDIDTVTSKKRKMTSGIGSISHRKVACESCRKRRRACKHKDTKDVLYPDSQVHTFVTEAQPPASAPSSDTLTDLADNARASSVEDTAPLAIPGADALASPEQNTAVVQLDAASPEESQLLDADDTNYLLKDADQIASTPKMLTHLSGAGLLRLEHRIAGGPVNGLSVLSLNAPHSRGRTKACSDCRRSKRRCIHDEYGNEDPVKAAEASIPRPAAANKRRKIDSEGNEIPPAKRSRKSSGSLLTVSGQESLDLDTPSKASPQQSKIPSTVRSPKAVMVSPSLGLETQVSDRHDTMLSAFDQIQVAAQSMHNSDPATMQYPEQQANHNSISVPAPVTVSSSMAPDLGTQSSIPQTSTDPHQHVRAVTSPPPPLKTDIPIDPALEHLSSSFSVPAASLVSPPASSHAGLSRTPPSLSAASSRHSSQNPKQMQRYTPESGPRRDSSSSVDQPPRASTEDRIGSVASEAIEAGKASSPMTTISITGEEERKSEPTRRKSRSSIDGGADKESLKLIKELQAQDYGLRRRGKT